MKSVSYRAEDNLRHWGTSSPVIGARVMIDPTAAVLGNIEISDDVSIWANCSVRADVHHITIGERTNVQDNSVLHVTHASDFNPGGWPLVIGTEVTVGHRAVLHGCTIGDRVLVGMGAIVMDGGDGGKRGHDCWRRFGNTGQAAKKRDALRGKPGPPSPSDLR